MWQPSWICTYIFLVIFSGVSRRNILINFIEIAHTAGVEMNDRPLARGEWKPRGMSRIFAEVVRRASRFCFCFFCLGLPLLVEKSLYPF